MTKVERIQLSTKAMNRAWAIYRAGECKNFKACLQAAWNEAKRVARILKSGILTFWKEKTEQVTVRRVAPLSDFPYERKTDKPAAPANDMLKFVDLEKLESGKSVEQSIISCHLYQIMETINAQVIFENMEPEFEVLEKSIEGTVITIQADTEYGIVTMSAKVTVDDDCASIEAYFTDLLKEKYKELEAGADYVDWDAEQGCGCAGNYL